MATLGFILRRCNLAIEMNTNVFISFFQYLPQLFVFISSAELVLFVMGKDCNLVYTYVSFELLPLKHIYSHYLLDAFSIFVHKDIDKINSGSCFVKKVIILL